MAVEPITVRLGYSDSGKAVAYLAEEDRGKFAAWVRQAVKELAEGVTV